ncbi:MAG: LytTR family DNA-binding domain-containing protein [Ruminococcus sp.]|jgi:DNA-binding LytR/AlgR family response regulator|nr:LytTR family DNA-binding domain-containing protein [Ruminococcus sp.]
MKIAVCDDEKIFFNELNELFTQYSKEMQEQIYALYFSTGRDLLSSQLKFDIIFMDYQMNDLDGMETCRILRTRKNDTTIIFLTSFPQVVFQSFEVNTFRFLVKPIKKQDVFDAINAYIKSVNNDDFLLINTNDGSFRLKLSEIIYIEAQGKSCIIRTVDNSFQSCKYLKEFEKLLPTDSFMRTHKSCIVHFLHINNHDNTTIYFDNGERGTIGKRYLSTFKKSFQIYIMRYNTRS